MSNLELAYLSATEQLRLFASRDLSPVDVLEAQIAQAEIAEPVINAFSETLYDDARKAAVVAEQRYRRSKKRLKVLLGTKIYHLPRSQKLALSNLTTS